MTFDEFRYRYFLITKTEFKNQPSKCIDLIGEDLYYEYNSILKDKPYQFTDSYAVIVDLKTKDVLAIVETKDKSFELNKQHFNVKALEKYKVKNKLAYNQNQIRMSSIENQIISTYGIDGVWSIIHYITKSNKERLLVNRNCFGKIALFKTRDYKLHKLLD
jgi:hypothetical protein